MKTFKESVLGDDEDVARGTWDLHDNFELDHNPCEGCGGKCCIGMYLDQGPEIKGLSEDAIRWAEAHEGVEIYKSEGRWGVKLPLSKCHHLEESGECAIHDERPSGCRQYFGMNPDGPLPGCALFKALVESGQVKDCKREWAESIWPKGIPKHVTGRLVD